MTVILSTVSHRSGRLSRAPRCVRVKFHVLFVCLQTALMMAASRAHEETLAALLITHANREARDRAGMVQVTIVRAFLQQQAHYHHHPVYIVDVSSIVDVQLQQRMGYTEILKFCCPAERADVGLFRWSRGHRASVTAGMSSHRQLWIMLLLSSGFVLRSEASAPHCSLSERSAQPVMYVFRQMLMWMPAMLHPRYYSQPSRDVYGQNNQPEIARTLVDVIRTCSTYTAVCFLISFLLLHVCRPL